MVDGRLDGMDVLHVEHCRTADAVCRSGRRHTQFLIRCSDRAFDLKPALVLRLLGPEVPDRRKCIPFNHVCSPSLVASIPDAISVRHCAPSKWMALTPAYVRVRDSAMVAPMAVTPTTRPPAVTVWPSSCRVPPWNTMTSCGTLSRPPMIIPVTGGAGYPLETIWTQTAVSSRHSSRASASRPSAQATNAGTRSP